MAEPTIEERVKANELTSMLHWWPRMKDTPGIPMPKTIIVELDADEQKKMQGFEGDMPVKIPASPIMWAIEAGKALGYPMFMRTDLTSCKHHWKDTCYVPSEDSLQHNISNLLMHNADCGMFGLPVRALVFREYIPMAYKFKAFYGDLPIPPERRYFVENGKVLCHHPYWPKAAIVGHFPLRKDDITGQPRRQIPHNWGQQLEIMNNEGPMEVKLLTGYAEAISAKLEGRWSIDFCKSKSDAWYFIDAAIMEVSEHQLYGAEKCPYNPNKDIKLDDII